MPSYTKLCFEKEGRIGSCRYTFYPHLMAEKWGKIKTKKWGKFWYKRGIIFVPASRDEQPESLR